MAGGGSPGGNKYPGRSIEESTRILKIKLNPNLSNDNVCVGPLAIYKMRLKHVIKTKQWQFGDGNPEINNKVVMMIGETGSGKTTLINALINCMFGVQWKHECRIQLVGEDPMTSQDHPQRSRVMVYQINHQPEFCIPHSLTIIDTPGLPETRGVTPQKKAIQQIRELFYNSGLNHIDAICFVTQSSMPDLSLTQKYVFNSLLAMFGPTVQENIVTFMTSAVDGQGPPALEAIINAKVPHAKDKNGGPIYFKFNNCVLYANNSPDDKDTNVTNEQQWSSGMEEVNNFLTFLAGDLRKNVALEKNILMRSNASEIAVDALVHKIEEVMSKQYELEETEKILRRHKDEIEKNEYFEFDVNKHFKEKKDTKENCTNCHECNSTCHHDCLVAYDTFVYLCEVFYFNASCRVCGHKSSKHFSENFLWQNLVLTKKVTYWSLKMKYRRDDQEVLTYQMVLERLNVEIETLRNDGSQLILKATESIMQFTSIKSSEEFIELLINTEKDKRKNGFQGRIEMLEKANIRIRRR